MVTITLDETQYNELADALDYAIEAAQADMAESRNFADAVGPLDNVYASLLSFIKQHKENN